MLKHIKKQLLIKKNHIIYLIGFLIFIMILSPPIKASDDILHYGLDVNINIDDKKIKGIATLRTDINKKISLSIQNLNILKIDGNEVTIVEMLSLLASDMEPMNRKGLLDALMEKGVTINRPPRDGHMAFVRSPDNISFELLQKGNAKPPQEPWASMENQGEW